MLNSSESDEVKYYACDDEIYLYYVLEKSHEETKKGRLSEMVYYLKNGNVNNSRHIIKLFLRYFKKCLKRVFPINIFFFL